MQVAQNLQTALRAPPNSLASYLEFTSDKASTLCMNAEGWGPLSPFRYDFTPCFLDIWIATVAVFGLFAGGIAFWYLVRFNVPQPVKRDWHYYVKLVCVAS